MFCRNLIGFAALLQLLLLQTIAANNPELIQQLWKKLYNQLPDPNLPNRHPNECTYAYVNCPWRTWDGGFAPTQPSFLSPPSSVDTTRTCHWYTVSRKGEWFGLTQILGQRLSIRMAVVIESVEFGHAYDDYALCPVSSVRGHLGKIVCSLNRKPLRQRQMVPQMAHRILWVCRVTLRLTASWPVLDSRIAESSAVLGEEVLLDPSRVWHPEVSVPGARRLEHLSRRLELQSLLALHRPTPKTRPQQQQQQQQLPADLTSDYASDDPLAGDDSGPAKKGPPGRRRETQAPLFSLSESINVEVLCSPPNVKNYLGSIHCPIFLKHETFARDRPEFVWQDRTGCSVAEKANAKLSYATVSSKYSVAASSVSLEGEDTQPSLTVNLCFNPTGLVLRAAVPGFIFVLLSFLLLWSLSCGLQVVSIAQGLLVLLALVTWSCSTNGVLSSAARFSLIDAWFLVCFIFLIATFLFTLAEHRRLERILKKRQVQQQRRIYAALSASVVASNAAAAAAAAKLPPSLGGGGSGGSNCGCGGGCCGCAGYCPASANGYLLQGPGQTNPLGNSSPAPPLSLLHQSSPPGVLPTKLDLCGEAYLRSASCELSKDSTAIMSMGTALRLRCAKNGGLGVFETNDSNLGLMKSQYAATSSPATSGLLQPLNPVPPSYCTTMFAAVVPILFLLTTIIFWGSLGAQGTVPKECLTGSVLCQPLTEG